MTNEIHMLHFCFKRDYAIITVRRLVKMVDIVIVVQRTMLVVFLESIAKEGAGKT